MNPLQITSQIEIDATPEQVWAVLIDLAAYNNWNSQIRVIEAPANIGTGSEVKLCAAPGTEAERIFDVEITAIEIPHLLEWRGGEPDTFWGTHRFKLHRVPPDKTRFKNSETFSGAMASAILEMSRTGLEGEFQAFNEALQRRVESG